MNIDSATPGPSDEELGQLIRALPPVPPGLMERLVNIQVSDPATDADEVDGVDPAPAAPAGQSPLDVPRLPSDPLASHEGPADSTVEPDFDE